MHERTFILAIVFLDMMLMLAGGVMAWSHAIPHLAGVSRAVGSDGLTALLSTIMIAGVGAVVLYQLNVFVFDLVESSRTQRNSRLAALAFAAVTIAGGLVGMTLG